MGLHHRKLIPHLYTSFSNQTQSYSSTSSNNTNPPPTPPIFPYQHSLQISIFLIITITLLASSFLVLFCFAIYASFFDEEQSEEARDAMLDEEYGSIKSLISENIGVCKYKKGEGLVVEGTECSVCLSDFEDDEKLRILPKCNNAFHVSCIDTWIMSHSNCPLCRAPVVEEEEVEDGIMYKEEE